MEVVLCYAPETAVSAGCILPLPSGCWHCCWELRISTHQWFLLAHCVVSPLENKKTGNAIGNIEMAQSGGKRVSVLSRVAEDGLVEGTLQHLREEVKKWPCGGWEDCPRGCENCVHFGHHEVIGFYFHQESTA